LRYPEPLLEGILVRRYKRFLADVALPDGQVVATWCPNPGSMKSCIADRAPCRVSFHDHPRRKLQWTLEQVKVGGTWIMVHTTRANDVVAEAIDRGAIPELGGYPVLQRERSYGRNSRIDILLTDHEAGRAYVEVKNVTLLENGEGFFPDSVSERGTKHLRELMAVPRGAGRYSCGAPSRAHRRGVREDVRRGSGSGGGGAGVPLQGGRGGVGARGAGSRRCRRDSVPLFGSGSGSPTVRFAHSSG